VHLRSPEVKRKHEATQSDKLRVTKRHKFVSLISTIVQTLLFSIFSVQLKVLLQNNLQSRDDEYRFQCTAIDSRELPPLFENAICASRAKNKSVQLTL